MPGNDNRTTILIALVIVQIVAIAFLFARTLSIDESLNTLIGAGQSGPRQDVSTAPAPEDVAGGAADALTARQVRSIVREELRAQIAALASVGAAAAADPGPAPDPYSEFDYQQQYALVDQEMEFYISQGTISDADMAALQQEIAKLDPEGREEMLRRLVRALNSGELDGRL